MAHLLELITDEWSDPIMGAFFFLFLFIAFFSSVLAPTAQSTSEPCWLRAAFWKHTRSKARPKEMLEPYDGYWGTLYNFSFSSIFLSQHSVDLGMHLAKDFLNASPSLALAGWIALGTCVAYALFCIHAIYMLAALKPHGQRRVYQFLLSFPCFSYLAPLCSAYVISFWAGETFFLSQYVRERGLYGLGGCLLALPWLAYFALSSGFFKQWRELQRHNESAQTD